MPNRTNIRGGPINLITDYSISRSCSIICRTSSPRAYPPSKNTSNSIASSPKNSARRTKRGNSTTKPSTKGLSKLTTSRVTLGGSISHCSSSKTNCNGSCKPKPRPLRFLHFLLRQRRQLHRLARRLEHAHHIEAVHHHHQEAQQNHPLLPWPHRPAVEQCAHIELGGASTSSR